MECKQCGEQAKFTANYPKLGTLAFCSEECHRKFYIGCGEGEKGSMQVYLTQIRINALILEVIDWHTIKVLHMPFGIEPVTYRLANSRKFNKQKFMPQYIEDEKAKRTTWMKKLFAVVTKGDEEHYPIASVIPVGGTDGEYDLATIYVPENCDYCFRSLVAYAVKPGACIGDLGTSQTFAMMQYAQEKVLKENQTKAVIGKNWMAGAVKHPGALTAWGHRHHIIKQGGHWNRSNLAKAERYAAKTPGKTDDRRVRLAETFAKYRK